MKFPKKIYEEKDVVLYLEQRNIMVSYIKACKYLTAGRDGSLNFKERKPQGSGIWSFRITQKYRAYGYRRDENFVVVEINDHQ